MPNKCKFPWQGYRKVYDTIVKTLGRWNTESAFSYPGHSVTLPQWKGCETQHILSYFDMMLYGYSGIRFVAENCITNLNRTRWNVEKVKIQLD